MLRAAGIYRRTQRFLNRNRRFITLEEIQNYKVSDLKDFLKQRSIKFRSTLRKAELQQLAMQTFEDEQERSKSKKTPSVTSKKNQADYDALFEEILGKETAPKAEPVKKRTKEQDDIDALMDELFSTPSPSKKSSKLPKAATDSSLDEFESIFTAKPTQPRKNYHLKQKEKQTDLDLDDIFGSPNTKKKNESAFDLDDIFSPSSTSAKRTASSDPELDSLLDDILGGSKPKASESKPASTDNSDIDSLLNDIFNSSPKKSMHPRSTPSSQTFAPKKSEIDALLDDILSNKPSKPQKRVEANFDDLESLIDDFASKTRGVGSWTTRENDGGFMGMDNERHKAIMDIGSRSLLLLKDNAELLRELKTTVRGVRMHVARENFLEIESNDKDRMPEVAQALKEIVGHQKEIFIPENWIQFVLPECEEKLQEIGCEVARNERTGMVIVTGESQEQVSEGIQLVCDILKTGNSFRYPRFAMLVKPVIEKALDAISELSYKFFQDRRPDASPFIFMKGSGETIATATKSVRDVLASVQLRNDLGPKARLIYESPEFKEFCTEQNIDTFYRQKRFRLYYHSSDADLNERMNEFIESLGQKMIEKTYTELPKGLAKQCNEKFPSLSFECSDTTLAFDPTTCNVDDVMEFLDSFDQDTNQGSEQFTKRINILDNSGRLIDVRGLEEELGCSIQIRSNYLIVNTDSQSQREDAHKFVENELKNVTVIEFADEENHVITGHKLRRIFTMARDSGLDKYSVGSNKLLLKGSERAKEEVQKYVEDLKENIVRIPVPGPVPIDVWAAIEAEEDLYVNSAKVDDQWYLLASEKHSYNSNVSRKDLIEEAVINHVRMKTFLNSFATNETAL